eukprot:TRINITY_DN2259_c0_g1_i1.p1 TRINITY_DN2259_c0_g1~~TRINITY_DN2259_c0_g1_i1.p1  ORF type:complete len:469 (+),score=108.40 TRINITY_DN2259_c0_g1_i1:34-1440(+)
MMATQLLFRRIAHSSIKHIVPHSHQHLLSASSICFSHNITLPAASTHTTTRFYATVKKGAKPSKKGKQVKGKGKSEEKEEEDDDLSEIDKDEAAEAAANFEYQRIYLEETAKAYEIYEEDMALADSRRSDLDKEVTLESLDKEETDRIQQLWEPYHTDDFNPDVLLRETLSEHAQKTLLNPNAPKGDPDARSSKLLYYSDADIEKYFPEGLAGRLTRNEFTEFPKKAILVRPVVEDVVAWCDEWRRKQFIGRQKDEDYYVLLDGPRGVGKSTALNPIVHWARLEGWLVVFIPDGPKWISTGHLGKCRANPKWFSQPELGVDWTKKLLQVHEDKLTNIPLRTTFIIDDFDPQGPKFIVKQGDGKTIVDLLKFGLQYPELCGDCIWHFKRELAVVTEYPVLVVVDGINALMHGTNYGDPVDPYIFSPNLPAERLTLSRAFNNLRHHGLANGLVVATVSYLDFIYLFCFIY